MINLSKTQNGHQGLAELKQTPYPFGKRSRRSRIASPPAPKISIRSFLETDTDSAFKHRRIRICVADVSLQIGGAEWFSALLMKYSNSRIFEFVILCYKPAKGGLQKYLESLDVKIVSAVSIYGEDITYDEWLNDKFFAMADLWNPDLIFFSSQYLYGELPLEKIRHYRTVVRISNFDASIDDLDFSAVEQIICCSDEQYSHLKRKYPEKVNLIKTGVDLEQFYPVKRDEKLSLRQELGLEPSNRIILFCGRLSDPLKRTALFREVAERILAERNDVTFLVIGYFERHRNAEETAFEEFADRRGIDWRKNVMPAEIVKYFQASDVLLSVSDKGEGLSNTVLQGLASGLISAVTPASGMSDLIEHGQNGFILQDDDPNYIEQNLLRLIDLSDEEKQTISSNARRHAERVFNLRDKVCDYQRAFYSIYKKAPITVRITDAVFGIGGAEWLAALLCLNSDSEKLNFSLVLHRNTSPLAQWLEEKGVPLISAPPEVNYDQWRDVWAPRLFRQMRPHIVMPCTSTSWNLSFGKHRFLGISQNASDRDVLTESQYEKADYIICVSEDVKEALDQRYHYKMMVLRNSIDPVMFHRNETNRKEVRARLGFTGNQKIVLWTGRLAEHRKRVDILREVIEKCSDDPELHFMVLGFFKLESEPEQQKQWEEFVGRQANVTWISGARNWESPAYFSAADFYLSTSGYNSADFEGLSLAAVQALAAGLPIVTTASGGMGEVVTEGVNGFLTPVGDSKELIDRLKKLCRADESEIDSIRHENVQKASELFDIKAHARRYETICWTLKNTVDTALAYNPQADTELLDFEDASEITAEQRHKASVFVNHISPLLIDNAREIFPDQTARENLENQCEKLSVAFEQIGGMTNDLQNPELIVLENNLSYEGIRQALTFAENVLVAKGLLVLKGFGNLNNNQKTKGRGIPACVLLDYLEQNFPLWCEPFQIGSSVVLRKR